MPTSGIIATKEDVLPFADSCVVLRWQWRNFEILFRGTDLKRELLALQLLSLWTSESMGNHDSNVMGGANSVD
jgi:hypothetical protein